MQTKFPICKLVLFALLSFSDFVITYMLLSRSQGRVYESNPVADQWLQQAGWVGLAAFKAAIVFGVSMIAIYIYYRRPRIAHDLLALACGAVVVAVVTGSSIAMSKPQPANPEEEQSWAPALVSRNERTLRPTQREYGEVLDEAAYALATHETNLESAVAVVEKSARARDAEWLESLRLAYPGVEERALVAADLLQHTIGMRIRTPEAPALAKRLERQFRKLYGFEPKLPYRSMLHLSPKAITLSGEGIAIAGATPR